jgi:hypothetical protein
MGEVRSIYRTDAQLEAILCDTGEWVIHGENGQVLCFAASLQLAVTRAADLAASGAVVVAITGISPDIAIFPPQTDRLRTMLVGSNVGLPYAKVCKARWPRLEKH